MVPPHQPLQPVLPPLLVCFLPKELTELESHRVRDIATEAVALGCRVFALTGGEPLIYPNFTDLVDFLLQFDQTHVMVLTNGVFLREYAAHLGRWPAERFHLQVSLDGLEQNHDRLRGQGAFASLMENLTWLKAQGRTCTLSMWSPRQISGRSLNWRTWPRRWEPPTSISSGTLSGDGVLPSNSSPLRSSFLRWLRLPAGPKPKGSTWITWKPPAIILTAFRNLGGDVTPQMFRTAFSRGHAISGGSCAFWGVCGAAAGVGIAFGLLLGANPLKPRERRQVLGAVQAVLGELGS